jgi:hypothetical protein
MFDSIISQYVLVGAAAAVLLAIKFLSVKKSYEKQLESFVAP